MAQDNEHSTDKADRQSDVTAIRIEGERRVTRGGQTDPPSTPPKEGEQQVPKGYELPTNFSER